MNFIESKIPFYPSQSEKKKYHLPIIFFLWFDVAEVSS